MGAAPARDPQLVALIVIRKPDKSLGYYGGQVAGPVVREILRHGLAYLQIPPDLQAPKITALSSGPIHD